MYDKVRWAEAAAHHARSAVLSRDLAPRPVVPVRNYSRLCRYFAHRALAISYRRKMEGLLQGGQGSDSAEEFSQVRLLMFTGTGER
jgi:hypothetical protein